MHVRVNQNSVRSTGRAEFLRRKSLRTDQYRIRYSDPDTPQRSYFVENTFMHNKNSFFVFQEMEQTLGGDVRRAWRLSHTSQSAVLRHHLSHLLSTFIN
jgi:hypothetical protein